jgi:PAS domain S-box-containing protein
MGAIQKTAGQFTSRFRATAILVAVLSLTAAGALMWTQWLSQEDLRQQLVEQSRQRAVQVGAVLAGRIEALIGTADFGLIQVREEFGVDESRFRTTVALLARSFPDGALLQISVAAADGSMTWSNLGLAGPVSIRDRDHFKAHLGGGDRLYVSKPLVGRVSGVWSVQFSRPILREGRFAGVIVLSIRPEYLARALASMETSPGDVMSLVDRDGAYIARSRDLQRALGQSVPKDRPFLHADAPPRGVYRATSRTDKLDRIHSWQKIPGTDLLVEAGLDLAAQLAPVERQIARDYTRSAVIAMLLVALGALIATLLLRLTREVETARHARAIEDWLTNAIEHLNEPVILTDAADRFVLTNDAFRKLNDNVAAAIEPGRKFEDYLRAGIAAGNYPDAAGREEAWLEERLAERRDPAGPVERVRPGDRWFQITDKRLPDGGMIRFSTEITSRKRVEAALRERERELRLIMDGIPVMIARSDRDERLVFVNRAYERLMERTSADLLGHGIGEIVAPEIYAQVRPYIERVLGGETVGFERTQLRKDGQKRHLDVLYVPDTDSQGNVAGWFAIHWDVTGRKLAERALADSEARFRAIFDRSLAGISLSDLGGSYLSVNQAYCDLVGYAAKELVGRMKVQDLFDQRDEKFAELYRRLRSGEISHFDRDRRYRRRDGTQLWGRVVVVLIRDAEQRPTYVLAIVVDVTEVHAAREKIERMNAELEERVAARTEELRATVKEMEAFNYTVSHDLRAPLGAINGFTQLLQMKEAGRLSEDGRKLLGFVESNANRMVVLVEGLLEFSRLGRQELARRQVAMSSLVREVLGELQAERHATLRLGWVPACDGDPLLLKQVWTNLIGNALKYTRGRGDAQIEIGFEAATSAYFVRDNGAGFDMRHAAKLFGVFERLHREDEFEGTGLGLAIVERIIRRHGGRIWAEAHPGKGAKFTFTVNHPGSAVLPAAG